MANLRLVKSVAQHHTGQGMELLDLIQAGNMALIGLVSRFAPEKPIRFSTYAMPSLHFVMRRALRDYARLIRIPAREQDALARVRRLQEQESIDETALAEAAGMTSGELAALLNAAQGALSLDSQPDSDGEDGLIDAIARLADDAEPVDDKVCRQMDESARLSEGLRRLSAVQRQIIGWHYGQGQSYVEIGQRLGCSDTTAWREGQKAVAVLREVAMDYYVDPMSGQMMDDYESEATVTTPALPAKGQCNLCGHRAEGVRGEYCTRSARRLDKTRDTDWCVPCALGDPYIPKAGR